MRKNKQNREENETKIDKIIEKMNTMINKMNNK